LDRLRTGTYSKREDKEIRPSRSLWDWLGLLIIPFVITAGGILFAYLQNERQKELDAQQQELENQRAQLLALEEYLDEVGNLLLNKRTPLRQSHEGDPVRDLARARTLTMLDMLSADRKPRLLEFLFEMELIQADPTDRKEPIISLRFADLREVDLARRHLLKGADLENADLYAAILRRAVLSNTDLRKADLSNAQLAKADLTEADLTEVICQRLTLKALEG
jgi:hypothetical protein